MSAETSSSYSQPYITFWTVLSIVPGLGLMSLFLFGQEFLSAGHVVWNFLRWLASPII